MVFYSMSKKYCPIFKLLALKQMVKTNFALRRIFCARVNIYVDVGKCLEEINFTSVYDILKTSNIRAIHMLEI